MDIVNDCYVIRDDDGWFYEAEMECRTGLAHADRFQSYDEAKRFLEHHVAPSYISNYEIKQLVCKDV